jgi:D-psicose/D-tagatose/L-ribulose 3-epimerase
MAKFSFIIIERPDSFVSFDAFDAALRSIRGLGYSGVEFNLTGESGYEVDAIARLVDSINLPIVSFLTGTNYFSEGLCLSSPRAEIRQRAVQRLQTYTKIAAQFGAVLVIGQMQGFPSDEPNRVVGEERIEECLKPIIEAAEKHGTTIAFEPVNHLQAGFHPTLADVMALAGRLGSDRFKPMLDTFHMNIEEKSMIEPIHRVGSDLAHFHLCESTGSFLGTGHFDFKAILAALDHAGYAGYVSVKVYRQPWAIGARATMQFLTKLKEDSAGGEEHRRTPAPDFASKPTG